ncbi:MAG: 6-carboxytetrahydropterin synthase [Gemmatimonadetes bacterium]|nr:6-carboxytetrahydropterin synthase [Gemmatimonadota bacterium]MBK6780214.1 6-carboxytetrahydropterin synthase [Gemmatimonadota bacterium]MBK7350956.1 6-carboxytetrahydropterin synthase [Gemmatimonadota bacterium]MBK7786116.1 6-carboxytetrahydropterin synthase [Gemmatimonadota bacterium]MBK7922482.1 6-carboxytetrahydropterin synthase [Gemmatimonadota bacterium]
MGLTLTRILGFRATHHYRLPGRTAEENRARFGDLTEPHPHDYTCAVTVGGAPDPASGMLLDLPTLDRILADEVGGLDGRDLNAAIPPFATCAVQPTCEALAAWLFARIAPRLPAGARLHRVRVAEGPSLYADCTADD